MAARTWSRNRKLHSLTCVRANVSPCNVRPCLCLCECLPCKRPCLCPCVRCPSVHVSVRMSVHAMSVRACVRANVRPRDVRPCACVCANVFRGQTSMLMSVRVRDEYVFPPIRTLVCPYCFLLSLDGHRQQSNVCF